MKKVFASQVSVHTKIFILDHGSLLLHVCKDNHQFPCYFMFAKAIISLDVHEKILLFSLDRNRVFSVSVVLVDQLKSESKLQKKIIGT